MSRNSLRGYKSKSVSMSHSNMPDRPVYGNPFPQSMCSYQYQGSSPKLKNWPKYILHPDGIWRKILDCLVIFWLIYSVFSYPYIMAFDITLQWGTNIGYILFVSDIFIFIDLCVGFITARYHSIDPLLLVTDYKLIAEQYIVHGSFIFDILSSVPLYNIKNEVVSHILFTVKFSLRFGKLFMMLRVRQILSCVGRMQNCLNRNRNILKIVKIVKYIALMFLLAHICACVWFVIGRVSMDAGKSSWRDNYTGASRYQLYIASLYWSVATVFTTGYGDIIAENEDEQIASIVAIFIGTCVFAFLVCFLYIF